MSYRNNSNLGDQIKDTVQDALDTMNFERLNQDITNSVRNALDDARRGLKGSNNLADDWVKNHSEFSGSQTQNQNNTSNRGNRERDYRERQRREREHRYSGQSYQNNTRNNAIIPRMKNPPGWVSSTLLQVFGYTGTVLFGIAILVLLILNFSLVNVFVLGKVAVGLSPLLFISFYMAMRGGFLKNRLKRYKLYVKYLSNKSYCTIKELSTNFAKNEKYIAKDLRKMIQLGMFPEGHLDEQNTCLILDNETYEQYRKTLSEYKQREKDEYLNNGGKQTDKEDVKQNKNDKTDGSNQKEYASEELRKTIEEGNAFIIKIRTANDAIPGEEISRKLDRLEAVISKIFECVKVHPEQLPELKKFMEYYLPTTLKLVSAYEEFDAQPVQGDNIRTAKNEIEKTLDTINLAFENLLDSLYEDAAMEISTDISVLETLLKREGLTEKDFDFTKGGK
ncbi:5-bromo-4-chloroindolyl phosphate hydrolysis family protein [Anaeromicropila herbilytica]|uniref:5-bromo-4-chloroindolyl phosphate hydrolysis protein n=1 Tax=Anaeromicropila herbilytica TaxID=2785025 RepID=A0A7R7ICC5_9FIRM|nr:5-bromo-4-chloroindolyl phosphate hydrolysis family protein [Anaeromicropila herbilytica]BCN30457.1 hypothetical protein bsdtb5_17520 [Anaeromicropila herbilytica]